MNALMDFVMAIHTVLRYLGSNETAGVGMSGRPTVANAF